ncbi:MAG TPA: CbtA family protein [Candidatus Binataceae bacterium]|nr:CbtA family protein [Candidatus Binataceae bacterium]
MTTLSRTLYAALVAGAAAGVLLFVLQSWTTLPLIHQAERYETGQAPVHTHSHANEPSDNQLVRAAYTATGDVLVGIGFAMLLTAMYALSGKSGLGRGLLWGLAGFATFHLAPALIVPPSIPALELAPLSIRQAAWLTAAFCTGLGLAIFAFGPIAAKVGGLLLLFLPSVLFRFFFSVSGSGIPSPALSALEHLFVVYVLGDFLLFWLVLGAISGWMLRSSGRPSDRAERGMKRRAITDVSAGRRARIDPDQHRQPISQLTPKTGGLR